VDGRWAFFGQEGRVFFARTLLGPIEELKHPASPVRSMSAGKGVALAVTMAGDLLRSTDGSRWTPAPVRGLAPAWPRPRVALLRRDSRTPRGTTAVRYRRLSKHPVSVVKAITGQVTTSTTSSQAPTKLSWV
jgi:hypothetical protein